MGEDVFLVIQKVIYRFDEDGEYPDEFFNVVAAYKSISQAQNKIDNFVDGDNFFKRQDFELWKVPLYE